MEQTKTLIAKSLAAKTLAGLEQRLERMGAGWATAALTAAAVLSVFLVYVVLKVVFEHQPITPEAIINIPLENIIVAVPLILYSRSVIRKLAGSRAELQAMSSQLTAVAEGAQEANRAKSAFLANMSHELRTPLNAILGFSEIMKDEHLGPLSNTRYLSYAADIHASGRHLLGIINDVLDLAKIESGKMSLDSAQEFALVPSLSATMTMLTGLGEKHGVALTGRWENEDVRLMAVERMVRQIVINLVGNAIKFTPQGGRVLLSGAVTPDGAYHLSVRDTGVGMSQGEIVTALTPFGQNRNQMTGRHEGTGLGLPLAKAMMELHDGSLTIQSQPEAGTCVTLHFPAQRVARPRARAAA